MNIEIEAKFLDIDIDDMRAKLKSLGAVREQPMRLMRRVTYDNRNMKSKGGWVRVRDEGNRVTTAYKQIDSLGIEGMREVEVVVSDFAAMRAIYDEIGFRKTSYQESKRETWKLDDVEIVLDEWPWLRPFMEIEGPSKEKVYDMAILLGRSAEDEAVYGDVMAAYRVQYPGLGPSETISNLAEARFGTPLPNMLKNTEFEGA